MKKIFATHLLLLELNSLHLRFARPSNVRKLDKTVVRTFDVNAEVLCGTRSIGRVVVAIEKGKYFYFYFAWNKSV